jgi:hypothetical protein
LRADPVRGWNGRGLVAKFVFGVFRVGMVFWECSVVFGASSVRGSDVFGHRRRCSLETSGLIRSRPWLEIVHTVQTIIAVRARNCSELDFWIAWDLSVLFGVVARPLVVSRARHC